MESLPCEILVHGVIPHESADDRDGISSKFFPPHFSHCSTSLVLLNGHGGVSYCKVLLPSLQKF